MDEALIFLHIAKAGGTTFEGILARFYSPAETYALDNWDTLAAIEKLKATPPHQLSHVRLLKGHMPYGLHQYLPGPSRYITFLRHPVERIISMYYFVRRTPDHYLHQAVMDQNMDLESFVRSGLSPELDNAQVKAVSGNFTHYGQCTSADLVTAKSNIENHFAVVGVTERYDESLLLMRRALRWKKWPRYRQANVTPGRPSKNEIDIAAIEAIRNINHLDVMLYDWALQQHDNAVKYAGLKLSTRLAIFKLINR